MWARAATPWSEPAGSDSSKPPHHRRRLLHHEEVEHHDTTHVVIVGGGFAGIACAKRLATDPRVQVTVIDKNGYHQFQPLLYQVATGELPARDTAFDLQRIFRRHDNVQALRGEVTLIDPVTRTATLSDGRQVMGDILVLAAGSQPNFFQTVGAEQHAYPLYCLDDAQRLRTRVLELFREAAAKPELVDQGWLTFVVIGGGPTGVELAGALAELVHGVMPYVYHDLAVTGAKVVLVDVGHALLATFSDQTQAYAARQLHMRGVVLKLGVSAQKITEDSVVLSDGSTIPSRMVAWAGGVKAAAVAGDAAIPYGHGRRINVEPDLTVNGDPRLYAVGDAANIPHGEQTLPQLASVARQSGDWAARNILAELSGGTRMPFAYRDKGMMVMIGKNAAVADSGRDNHQLRGWIAFAAWLGLHAELLGDLGAEVNALVTWADEFYLRPHHHVASLLSESTLDTQRIAWETR